MKIWYRGYGCLVIAACHPKWSVTWAWALHWEERNPYRQWYWFVRTNKKRAGLYGIAQIGRLRFERQPTVRRGS